MSEVDNTGTLLLRQMQLLSSIEQRTSMLPTMFRGVVESTKSLTSVISAGFAGIMDNNNQDINTDNTNSTLESFTNIVQNAAHSISNISLELQTMAEASTRFTDSISKTPKKETSDIVNLPTLISDKLGGSLNSIMKSIGGVGGGLFSKIGDKLSSKGASMVSEGQRRKELARGDVYQGGDIAGGGGQLLTHRGTRIYERGASQQAGGEALGKVGNIFGKLGKSISSVGSSLMGALAPLILIGVVIEPLMAFLEGFLEPLGILSDVMGSLGSALGVALIPIMIEVSQLLVQFMPVMLAIGQILAPIIQLLLLATSPIFLILDALSPFITKMTEGGLAVNGIVTKITEFKDNVLDFVKSFIPGLFNIIKDAFKDGIGSIKENVKNWWKSGTESGDWNPWD